MALKLLNIPVWVYLVGVLLAAFVGGITAHFKGPLWAVGAAIATGIVPLFFAAFSARRSTKDASMKKRGQVGADRKFRLVSEISDETAGVNPQVHDASSSLYISRDVEQDARARLLAHRKLLLVGAPMSGKTRLALEIVRQLYPDWKLWIPSPLPHEENSLFVAFKNKQNVDQTVLWLDEFHRFTHPDLPQTLNSLLDTHKNIAIVGTIRSAEEQRLRESPPGAKNPFEACVNWFYNAEIHLAPWSEAEQERLYQQSPVLAARVEGIGLPQFLAGTPELDRVWREATTDERGLLRLCIHWCRLGMRKAITEETISELASHYLHDRHDTSSKERIRLALENLLKRTHDTVAPIERKSDGYRVSDYLLERQDISNDFPQELLDTALEATSSEESFTGALVLYHLKKTQEAVRWWTQAARHGNTDAMFNLGLLLKKQGKTEQAKSWWTQAAHEEDTDAMFNLGLLLNNQGDKKQAKKLWTAAATAGDSKAMCALAHSGFLPEDEAREWAQKAREAGFDCKNTHL